MLLVVCLNVDFAVRIYQGEGGIAVRNIQKLFGNVQNQQKHGKRFCPDSKGIPEQVIEDAFIESYRMLCTDHKDVQRNYQESRETLSEDSIEDKIEKLNRSVYNIQYKRKSCWKTIQKVLWLKTFMRKQMWDMKRNCLKQKHS